MNDNLMKHLSGFEKTYPHKLEARYPQMVERITELWGTPELDGYFHTLMIDERGNWRAFPPDIASEILLLNSAYDKIRAGKGAMADARADQGQTAKQDLKLDDAKFVPSPIEKEAAQQELKLRNLDFAPSTMLKLAESDDPAPLVLFLNAGMPVDIRDERGWTSLMVSSFHGNETVAEVLIRYGANLTARDRGGYTPLHWAALNGYRDVVHLIASNGVDINIQSNYGWTPLLQTAAMGHVAIARDLLEAGADPNLASHDGWTPLHKSVANGHKEVVAVLLKHGARVLAQYEDGSTPLSLAQKNQDPEILEMLRDQLKNAN